MIQHIRRSRCIATAALLFAAGHAAAESYPLPPDHESVIGQVREITAVRSDTLSDIARRFNIGYEEIRLANPGVDPWLPGAGTRVVLPSMYVLPDAPREGIVLNLAEMRLYFYPKPRRGQPTEVITYPVSIGRADWQTPLGLTRIVSKVKDPAWYPPASVREEHAEAGDPLPEVVPAGPDNPLGRHALRLAIPGYLLHGTNKPYGVGMQVSHGCVRLYPENIEALFGMARVGTPVRIVNQRIKAGWRGGVLYLEVHPQVEGREGGGPKDLTPLVDRLVAATRDQPDYQLDWDYATQTTREPLGLPLAVGSNPQKVSAREDGGGSQEVSRAGNMRLRLSRRLDTKTGGP